jgi:CheY-like chemotaxis protein
MLIGDWLRELGCEVVGPAENVARALEFIEAEGEALDAAMLDVTLREGESYAIADALKLRGIPFAFVTGHGVGGLAAGYRNAPLLDKPFMPDDLRQMVARLVALKTR